MFKINDYKKEAKEHKYINNLTDIKKNEAKELITVGIDINEKDRAGTFIQKDMSTVHCQKNAEGIEIFSIDEAKQKYPNLKKDYMWKIVNPEKDEFTKYTNQDTRGGYFIKSLKNQKIKKPIQACMNISQDAFLQRIHNLVIAEENSYMHIIAGCSTSHSVQSSLHIGVSEFYVKKGATLVYTMIHNWGEKVNVRPRTGIIVEEGGVYISNYISLKTIGSLQMNPITYLNGKNSVARLNSIVVADEKTNIDIGSDVFLNGEESKAEIISRVISLGGTVITKGKLVGNAKGIKAHLECKGLILKEGILHAIPELIAKVPNIEMSHEAAVGKIDKREIEYLMSRGLDEETATSTIVRGFLNVDIEGLPEELKNEIDMITKKTQLDSM